MLLLLQKRMVAHVELVGGGKDGCRLELVGDDLALGGQVLELLGEAVDVDAVVVVLLHWMVTLFDLFC